ncbi:hypothetical protein [Brenneria corticis]|uniref:hypothetical protein n=1 Tax=Brenneria corticis TaxID=2173106 RepID=UPI00109DE6AB|nr:hypothetical protein [Brenneria sp. CFCC 11842]
MVGINVKIGVLHYGPGDMIAFFANLADHWIFDAMNTRMGQAKERKIAIDNKTMAIKKIYSMR